MGLIRVLRRAIGVVVPAWAAPPDRMVRRVIEPFFDRGFYVRTYPDVAATGTDPLRHFLEKGWREHRNPNPHFDTGFYLSAYPDVAAAGINPLFHYVTDGVDQGRLPARSTLQSQFPTAALTIPAEITREPELSEQVGAHDRSALLATLETLRPHFDGAFYLDENPDVARAGIDPVEHFAAEGWREGRNPSADFDVSYYLSTYPDVRDAGINPLWHYIVSGKDEGRLTRRPVEAERQLISQAMPPRERLKGWSGRHNKAPLSRDRLRDALGSMIPTVRDKWAISVSHDEYLRVPGGIQNCVSDEQRELNGEGWLHIHLCPAEPRLLLADAAPDELLLSVTIDGERVAHALASDLLVILSERAAQSRPEIALMIHSALGHSLEVLADLAELPHTSTFFWVHDFFSLCPNFTLLRNDVEFCGAPPVTSNACMVCVYGEERGEHLPRFRAFFERVSPTVLAPSEAALDVWKRGGYRHSETRVLPHAQLRLGSAEQRSDDTGRLKVAFLGVAVPYKGAHVFEELVRRVSKRKKYDFYHFGELGFTDPRIQHVEVRVSANHRAAMVDALRREQIDIVVIWSLCHETFSFTTYEALAAGAFVIARLGAGNVDAVLRANGQAWQPSSERELIEAFESDEVWRLFEAARTSGLKSGELVPEPGLARNVLQDLFHA